MNGLQLFDAAVFLFVQLLHILYGLIAEKVESNESVQLELLA
jgi:hypothetical protein